MTTTREATARGLMHDIMCLPDEANIWVARKWAAEAHAALSTPATEPQGYVDAVVKKLAAALWLEAEGEAVERLYDQSHQSFVDEYEGKAREILAVSMPSGKADHIAALAARPAPQPAADTRVVTDAMIEKATMVLLGKNEDPAPGVDWVCERRWTVNAVRLKMGQALRAIIGTATPAPSDKIAEAAQLKAISLALAKITGRDADDEAALDSLAAEIRSMRALGGKDE